MCNDFIWLMIIVNAFFMRMLFLEMKLFLLFFQSQVLWAHSALPVFITLTKTNGAKEQREPLKAFALDKMYQTNHKDGQQ